VACDRRGTETLEMYLYTILVVITEAKRPTWNNYVHNGCCYKFGSLEGFLLKMLNDGLHCKFP
jgi:hypothetical protein